MHFSLQYAVWMLLAQAAEQKQRSKRFQGFRRVDLGVNDDPSSWQLAKRMCVISGMLLHHALRTSTRALKRAGLTISSRHRIHVHDTAMHTSRLNLLNQTNISNSLSDSGAGWCVFLVGNPNKQRTNRACTGEPTQQT